MAKVVIRDRNPQYDWTGPLADRPASAVNGSTYYDETNSILYLYGSTGWVVHPDQVVNLAAAVEANIAAMKAKVDTMQADVATEQDDVALIKAQNQTAKPTSHSFAFEAADTVKTSVIAYNGTDKHLHLVVPNFTEVATATVTLVDASGRILWTSAAKAKNASYNLETEAEWIDQLVDNTLIWTVTLSGVPGGDGGTVVLVPRYYGV